VIDTQEHIQYTLSQNNNLVTLKLTNPKLLSRTYNNLFYRDSRIQKTTIKRTGDVVQIFFWLKKQYSINSFFLNPNKKYPHHRLVIDIKDTQNQQKIIQKIIKNTPNINQKIIVLDAGHGGEDPGAIGSHSKEKDIVLAITKKLQKLLRNNPRFKVVLTRNNDYYVKLTHRPTLAQQHLGDAFISIHADSALRKTARGASVYMLSKKGGTTKLAKKLEQSENADDIFGNKHIEKDWVLNSIMRDLARDNKKTESYKLATTILQQLGKIGKLHKKTPQKANFVVLKTPAIPSVLVEVAFLSNTYDEQRLRNPKEQQRIANALYQGIINYFK
jgi:N-acetylmuramoyl-L-alanine amidase